MPPVHEAEVDDISVHEVAQSVLQFQKQTVIDVLVDKLAEQDIRKGSDLLKLSQAALEMRLSGLSATFTIDEVSHAITMREYAEKHLGKKQDKRRSRSPRERKLRGRSPIGASKGKGKGYNGKGKGNGRHRAWSSNRRRVEPEKPSLWAAVERNDEEEVERLLDDGADIEQKPLGWSPLMKAAEENHGEILQMLLERKADLNVKNRKGRTALSFAVGPSMKRPTALKTLRYLLEAGANPLQKDDNGWNAKTRAMKEEREDALAVLQEFEAKRMRYP